MSAPNQHGGVDAGRATSFAFRLPVARRHSPRKLDGESSMSNSESMDWYRKATTGVPDIHVDYADLARCLSDQLWHDAFTETKRVVRHVAHETVGFLNDDRLYVEHVISLPCSHLQKIDALWSTYSGQHFRLSVKGKSIVIWAAPYPTSIMESGPSLVTCWLAECRFQLLIDFPSWPFAVPFVPRLGRVRFSRRIFDVAALWLRKTREHSLPVWHFFRSIRIVWSVADPQLTHLTNRCTRTRSPRGFLKSPCSPRPGER